MTQIGLLRALMPVARIVLPFTSRRRRYQLLHVPVGLLMLATFPFRHPRLWWYCQRIKWAIRRGQWIIEA